MQWDLGIVGVGLVLGLAIGFGLVVQLIVGRMTTRWLWLICSAVFFVGGLLTSEVWFGWATERDLQPNIDGVSFDEVLLIDMLMAAIAILVVWLAFRHRQRGARPGARPGARHRGTRIGGRV
ncbi:MAG TPA: hypothetical protein VFL69_02105 [Marmoricola sp.]|nr:hypothetical protein [Marmoricola sp.]